MDEKLLLETVLLAGELMLVSGAEVYRVQDTMEHMLKASGYQAVESTFVMITGIFVTLTSPGKEPMTMTRRIPQRSTNVNRVYLVNNISRRYCAGELSLKEAYEELLLAKQYIQYKPWMKALGNVGVACGFTPIFGGTLLDFFAALFVGVCLALADRIVKKIRLNDFCNTAFCAFAVAFSSMAMEHWLVPGSNAEVMTISAIMTLVPGVTFTTAIRDTLNGDYAAGAARMLEAVVAALAVAAGVAGGILLFGVI